MRKELEKNYNPQIVEDRIYSTWLEKKYFHAIIDKNKEPFTIVIPPPNITGQLHLGHALDNVLQDALIRTKRMQGYNALWVPGTDHASIATEVKIVNKMAEEGITKKDLGREAFLERAWDWKKTYGGEITNQLKKLGSSLDWDRERFTMDEGLSKAVQHVFIKLYNKGLIYKGERLINWCPHCKTSISDAEVDHEDMDAHFYHLKYKITDSDEYLTFATTRPETMLGDTAIAVNPKDERYKKYVGKTVLIPIVNREIPIIADNYVDIAFGTGVVKITPAHDPNDFEVGQRHNLPIINVLNDDGTINENGGYFKGLDRKDARKKIVEEFEKLGLLVKIEDLRHAVGVHERCGSIVEPLIKMQWFLKMDNLAKTAIDAYENNEIRFIPEKFTKVYINWLENLKDWCISRQLWWGHRIPAYYCDDCGNIEVSETKPSSCSKCNSKNLTQDEDTLDTWFSSALWPFSTLGWPDKTPDFEYFYPTSVLVTAYDIIFFWVIRMIFSGIEHTGKLPFKDILMHGLVLDANGKKMSKSLGNGVDPLQIIEKYGSDALRLTLLLGNSLGNDMRFHMEKLEANRNFLNKIWNATRFMLMHFDDSEPVASINDLTATDKWITSKVNTLVKNVTENINNYELGVAVSNIYDFIWDEYCDWYIEMVKPRLYNKEDETRPAALYTLKNVLITSLKLLHPFLPFITEEIFTNIQTEEESIMISTWPVYNEKLNFIKEEEEVEYIKEAVKSIRNVRTEMDVVPSKKTNIFIVTTNSYVEKIFEEGKVFFKSLAFANEIIIQTNIDGIGEDAIPAIIKDAVMYLPFEDLVDVTKELERLKKESEKLKMEVDRVEKKLSNVGFTSKAPSEVINQEREKQDKYRDMLLQVDLQIKKLSLKTN